MGIRSCLEALILIDLL